MELNENTIECMKFINENKFKYLDFLCSKIEGFPFVCDYSSMILASYLESYFDLDVDIISGSLDGNDDYCHFWIELDSNIKVDFTLCQFHEDNETHLINNDENINKFELLTDYKYVYDNLILYKVPFPFINDYDIWYDRLEYLEYTSCPKKLLDIAKESNGDFDKYLDLVSKI